MSSVKLLQGDCLELMKDIPDGSVDCIITDPPYGTTHCDWDEVPDLKLFFEHGFRVLKENGALISFSQLPFAVVLINTCRKYFRYEIIWQKTKAVGFLNANKMPLRAHENILVFYRKLPVYNPQKTKGAPYKSRGGGATTVLYGYKKPYESNNITGDRHPHDVLVFKNSNHNSLHPTQKPVELMEWLVKTYTNPGDTVLDCFMGSGTTGVASVRNGRKFIGMELQEKYFEIAKKRIEGELVAAGRQEEIAPFWNLSTGEFHAGGVHLNGEK